MIVLGAVDLEIVDRIAVAVITAEELRRCIADCSERRVLLVAERNVLRLFEIDSGAIIAILDMVCEDDKIGGGSDFKVIAGAVVCEPRNARIFFRREVFGGGGGVRVSAGGNVEFLGAGVPIAGARNVGNDKVEPLGP